MCDVILFRPIIYSTTAAYCDYDDDPENKKEESIALTMLIAVIVMIIIMACVVIYLLYRRKRLREGAKAIRIGDDSYVPLSSGDDDENAAKSDFKRIESDDSIYDDKQSEGQIVPLPQITPSEEGSGNVTTKKAD